MKIRKESRKKLNQLSLTENSTTATIAPLLSSLEVRTMVEGFSNKDDYEGLETLTIIQKPVSTDYLKRIGNDIVAFAKLPTTFSLREYLEKHDLFTGTICKWRQRDEYFKNCYDHAKEIIGNRREKWAATWQMDAGTLNRRAAIYSHEFREMKEWEASLAPKNQTPPQERVEYVVVRASADKPVDTTDSRTELGDRTTPTEATTETTGASTTEESIE